MVLSLKLIVDQQTYWWTDGQKWCHKELLTQPKINSRPYFFYQNRRITIINDALWKMNRCFQKCTKKSRFGLLHPTSPCTLNSILSFAHAAYSISYQSVSDNVLLSIVVFMWEVLWVTKHLLTSALILHTFIVCINNWKVATCLFKLTGSLSSKNAAEFLFMSLLRSYLFELKMGEISVQSFLLQ